VEAAKREGVLIGAMPGAIRCVTHYGVDAAGIERAGQVLAPLLKG